MARPIKKGLEYFPLDIDIDQDDKIALIEASYGLEGFGIIIKIFMKIYDNGYFYEWGEKEQLLFSRKVNVNINRVNDIINDCLKWNLFSKELYEKYKILTSRGIQVRYLEATTRRKEVKIDLEHLLINENEVNVYRNLVIADINSINDNISTQSKVKESKGKKYYIDFPINGDIFLETYNQKFIEKFNKPHMKISQDQEPEIFNHIEEIKSKVDSVREFEEITQLHFESIPENNDGNFLAFIHAFPRYLNEIRDDGINWDN